MLTLKVINLWCGPGGGKSTTAAGLFNILKNRGRSVELVTEVAKDMEWDKAYTVRENQLLVLGLQDQRLRRLEGQCEWAITDSPLPMGLVYASPEYSFLDYTAWEAYDRYQNFDVLIQRVKPYAQYGRSQTEEEARGMDRRVAHLWAEAVDEDTEFAYTVKGDERAPMAIYEWLFEHPKFIED